MKRIFLTKKELVRAYKIANINYFTLSYYYFINFFTKIFKYGATDTFCAWTSEDFWALEQPNSNNEPITIIYFNFINSPRKFIVDENYSYVKM